MIGHMGYFPEVDAALFAAQTAQAAAAAPPSPAAPTVVHDYTSIWTNPAYMNYRRPTLMLDAPARPAAGPARQAASSSSSTPIALYAGGAALALGLAYFLYKKFA